MGISDSSEIRLSTARLEAGQDCSETNTSHPLLHSAVARSTFLGLSVISCFKCIVGRLKTGSILEIDGDDIVYSSLADTYYVCLLVDGTFVHQVAKESFMASCSKIKTAHSPEPNQNEKL